MDTDTRKSSALKDVEPVFEPGSDRFQQLELRSYRRSLAKAALPACIERWTPFPDHAEPITPQTADVIAAEAWLIADRMIAAEGQP